MQQALIHLNASPQNFQVNSNNCCEAIIKSKHSSSQQTLSLSPRKRNSQKAIERGIKLTNTKSSTLLNLTKKVSFDEKTTTLGSSQKLYLKKINCTKPTRLVKQTENANSNPTKKCIEYKNRRIVQRMTTEQCYIYKQTAANPLKTSKFTIEKYTPRTTMKTDQEYVELSQVIDKNYQFSIILSNKNHNNLETENTKQFFKPSKSKKTLSRLYEQQLGRRVMTVQSQQNESESDCLSIIEPFEWRIELN